MGLALFCGLVVDGGVVILPFILQLARMIFY
jgi:hypothetical protein